MTLTPRPSQHTRQRGLRAGAALLGLLAAAPPALAAALSAAAQKTLHEAVAAPIAAKLAPGDALLLAEHQKILFTDAAGTPGPPPAVTLRPDMVIWVASMSKPITATAILMLAEQGKLKLTDNVARFIPEFASSQVKTPSGLVPASRPLTLTDLLTHISGIASGMIPPPAPPGAPPMPPMPGPPRIMPPPVAEGDTLATWAPKIASTPLEHQPGALWAYSPNTGFDILARVVEVASGQDFKTYVTTHILTPLGMSHTRYGMPQLPPDQMVPLNPFMAKDPRVIGTTYISGAAGVFSTMADYAHFAGMLADDGVYHGHRLLKASSVAAMRTNQVGDLFPGVLGRPPTSGEGFGYAMAIVLDPAASGIHVPAGSFGWDGAGGTRFWVMPATHRVMIEYGNVKAQQQIEQAVEETWK